MGEEIEREQEPEEVIPQPMPEITPDMIQTTLKALEAEGMVEYMSGGIYIPTESGWTLLMTGKQEKEEIIAHGHPNITATHMTTFEITKSESLGKEADCIIAVKANKACKDLSKDMRDTLKMAKKIEITIEAGGINDKIVAFGSPALKLTHPEEIVIRKRDFIDNRTLAILANKAAFELKRELVEELKKPETKVKITLEIKSK